MLLQLYGQQCHAMFGENDAKFVIPMFDRERAFGEICAGQIVRRGKQ